MREDLHDPPRLGQGVPPYIVIRPDSLGRAWRATYYEPWGARRPQPRGLTREDREPRNGIVIIKASLGSVGFVPADKRTFNGRTFTFAQMSKVKSALEKTARVFKKVGFGTRIVRLKGGPDKGFFVLYARSGGPVRKRRRKR